MAHIPGLYLKPESFSPSYGRKKMTDTQRKEITTLDNGMLTIQALRSHAPEVV